jgi:hypothetical protein
MNRVNDRFQSPFKNDVQIILFGRKEGKSVVLRKVSNASDM